MRVYIVAGAKFEPSESPWIKRFRVLECSLGSLQNRLTLLLLISFPSRQHPIQYE